MEIGTRPKGAKRRKKSKIMKEKLVDTYIAEIIREPETLEKLKKRYRKSINYRLGALKRDFSRRLEKELSHINTMNMLIKVPNDMGVKDISDLVAMSIKGAVNDSLSYHILPSHYSSEPVAVPRLDKDLFIQMFRSYFYKPLIKRTGEKYVGLEDAFRRAGIKKVSVTPIREIRETLSEIDKRPDIQDAVLYQIVRDEIMSPDMNKEILGVLSDKARLESMKKEIERELNAHLDRISSQILDKLMKRGASRIRAPKAVSDLVKKALDKGIKWEKLEEDGIQAEHVTLDMDKVDEALNSLDVGIRGVSEEEANKIEKEIRTVVGRIAEEPTLHYLVVKKLIDKKLGIS